MKSIKRGAAILMVLALMISGPALGEPLVAELPLSICMPGEPAIPAEDPAEPNTDYASQSDQVIGQHTARVYPGRLDRFRTLEVAEVKGYEDVPFVSVREFLRNLFKEEVTFRMEKDNNRFLIGHNGAVAELILSPLELRCDNWYWFFGTTGPSALPEGIVFEDLCDAVRPSALHEPTVIAYSFNPCSLEYEGIRAVTLDRDVLLPLGVLQSVFTLCYPESESFLNYNGDDFYEIQIGLPDADGDEPSPYEAAFRSGRFAQMEAPSAAYAAYNYACLCLTMDRYYGHMEEKGFGSLDAYAEAMGLREGLTATDPDTYREALETLICKCFDSGHDDLTGGKSVFAGKADTEEAAENPVLSAYIKALNELDFSELGEEDDPTRLALEAAGITEEELDAAMSAGSAEDGFRRSRGEDYLAYLDAQNRIASLKPENTAADGPVAFEDDTAFISFDSFVSNSDRDFSFYADLPRESDYPEDTFALLYGAFREITENPDIRNVVIDLSANGGGMVSAMTALLGFLSPDGEARLTYMDRLNRALRTEYYQVDTNLDGVFDEKDGYGDRYRFYILTSGASYSCGNATPVYAKAAGLATLLGEPGGGGDCTAMPFIDCYGYYGTISGFRVFGVPANGGFVSAEKTAIPDLSFGDRGDELYFNRPALVKFIHENP